MLNVRRSAETMSKRAVKHLVTPDARVAIESQTVLEANLQDGDMLQAVLFTVQDIVGHGERALPLIA